MDLRGKAFLVTGSTDGIGEHTATLLATRGATVFLHGRNPSRLLETEQKIRKVAPEAQLHSFLYDFSDMQQVKQFCADVLRTTTRLDGVVNNAGVFEESFRQTKDGLEMTFAVNVAAPFIIACLLMPLLRSTAQSRILNISSISQSGQIQLDNLQFEQGGWSSHKSYSQSKLLMAAFSFELAQRITAEKDTLVLCCDPGTVNTKMLLAGWGECGVDVSAANDELTLLTQAFDPASHGQYYVGCRKSARSKEVKDDAQRIALWEKLERLTQCTLPPPK